MAEIRLNDVSKVYGDGTKAVDRLNLTIGDGEFMVFVGPSGCGKTTALRMIAGLETVSEGTVELGDAVINDWEAKDRDIAMVFQSYALYPHMSVFNNLAFALKIQHVDKAEIKERVDNASDLLELSELLERKPRALSGGQRQRVAMGRAIVRRPQAFLMDEPLSNLDAKLRVHMRVEIARLQRELNVTTVYVTHDQSEAMTLGDRIAVMRDGVLQQLDPPHVVYARPKNMFVAEFIGSPAMNLVTGTLQEELGVVSVKFGSHVVRLESGVIRDRPSLLDYRGQEVVIGIRPEDVDDAGSHVAGEKRAGDLLDVVVGAREDMGSDVFLHADVGGKAVKRDDVLAAAEAVDDFEVGKGGAGGQGPSTMWVARASPESRTRVGDSTKLRINTKRMHFFDPVSGSAIWGTKATAVETSLLFAGES